MSLSLGRLLKWSSHHRTSAKLTLSASVAEQARMRQSCFQIVHMRVLVVQQDVRMPVIVVLCRPVVTFSVVVVVQQWLQVGVVVTQKPLRPVALALEELHWTDMIYCDVREVHERLCDDTEFVTLGGLVVGPKPFGTKGL